MQISFNQLEHHVQIFAVPGLDDGVQGDDVGVVELVQNCNFPIGALGIYFVLKGIEHLLEGVFFVRTFLSDFPDVAIGATTQELFDFEERQYMTFYFFAHYI